MPPGPAEEHNTSQDFLRWMSDNFKRFGDVYRASVYGTDVYVVMILSMQIILSVTTGRATRKVRLSNALAYSSATDSW